MSLATGHFSNSLEWLHKETLCYYNSSVVPSCRLVCFCCVFWQAKACLDRHLHGQKLWKTFENVKEYFFGFFGGVVGCKFSNPTSHSESYNWAGCLYLHLYIFGRLLQVHFSPKKLENGSLFHFLWIKLWFAWFTWLICFDLFLLMMSDINAEAVVNLWTV